MNDASRRHLLNPVPRLTKEAVQRRVSGGGKSESNIMPGRLDGQREVLVQALEIMSDTAAEQPIFNEQIVIHAIMFDDSLSPSYIPNDLFGAACGAQYIVPHRNGYLFQLPIDRLGALSDRITRAASVKELVDISRVQSMAFFKEKNVIEDRTIDSMWSCASQNGNRFIIWLMPLHGIEEREHLIEKFLSLQDRSIFSPPSLLTEIVSRNQSDVPAQIRRNLMVSASGGNRIAAAAGDYLRSGQAKTTVIIPSIPALTQLISSGTVLRIDPVSPIHCSAAGGGAHRDHPMPNKKSGLPVEGVVK